MRFRPCIDIHRGKVKQIVGGTLSDEHGAVENFISDHDAAWFAKRYARDGLRGGHVILLDQADSDWYEADKREAFAALGSAPDTLQAGGSVNEKNAADFLNAGASHVIVTSYVFHDGVLDEKRLNGLVRCVGKEHLVLDLSCRRRERDGEYVVVTNRWQQETDLVLNRDNVRYLAGFCDELLVHAADAEGKQQGPEEGVVKILADAAKILPVTYAGGIHAFEDLAFIRKLSEGKLDVTIGSALDLFGGAMAYDRVLQYCTDHPLKNG